MSSKDHKDHKEHKDHKDHKEHKKDSSDSESDSDDFFSFLYIKTDRRPEPHDHLAQIQRALYTELKDKKATDIPESFDIKLRYGSTYKIFFDNKDFVSGSLRFKKQDSGLKFFYLDKMDRDINAEY
jgi:hypothetical protein